MTERNVTLISNAGYATDVGLHFRPDEPALLQHGLQRTFRELDELANRVAQRLLLDGVAYGDRVFLIFENDIRYFEALLGAMRIGAVPVPSSTKITVEKMAGILTDCGASTVIASPKFAHIAGRLLAEGRCSRAIALGEELLPGVIGYDEWVASAPATRPEVDVDPDDTALQPYTSGTTGPPKGVLITHRGWLHNCDLMRRVGLISGADRALCSNPLFHTNAMGCGVFPGWLAGAASAVLPAFEPRAVIAAIEKWEITFTTGVPAMYKMILAQRDAIAEHDLSTIRFLMCGSAQMPASLLEELQIAIPGADVIEGYGLTEGGPLISILPRFGPRKIGSIGLVLPETEIRICDLEGNDVPLGEPGELWVRALGVAKGYHNRPEATAERFIAGGWLRSGDLIRSDGEGFLYFVGRFDDRINVAGEHAYPGEIEGILIEGVQDVCVVGVRHEVKGEVPVAFVVAHGPRPDVDELKHFYFSRGPAFAYPREIIFLDQLPIAATGKVDRTALAKSLNGQSLPEEP